jgi:DNA-binding transcriptional MocR family regulator
VGYVAAAPALAQRFIDTKLLGTLTTPSPLEDALACAWTRAALRRHAERVIVRSSTRPARAPCAWCARPGCRFAAPPQGLFGWVDVGRDTDRLAQRLLDDGCLIAPGSLFHARPRPTTLMRVNFAAAQDARFWRRLRDAGVCGSN